MKTEEEVQANLKFPKSLKDKLKAAAKENHRSMTAEVVARLQQSFQEDHKEAAYSEFPPETMLKLLDAFRHSLTEQIREGKAQSGFPRLDPDHVEFRDSSGNVLEGYVPKADEDSDDDK